MTKKPLILIIIFTGLLSASIAQQLSRAKPPRKFRKIQKYLDQATTERLMGVIVYIQSPKHQEWIGVSGFSNLETKDRIQKDNIISLASIGKMYNAVAVMKLVDQGRIRLDGKIANYL